MVHPEILNKISTWDAMITRAKTTQYFIGEKIELIGHSPYSPD